MRKLIEFVALCKMGKIYRREPLLHGVSLEELSTMA